MIFGQFNNNENWKNKSLLFELQIQPKNPFCARVTFEYLQKSNGLAGIGKLWRIKSVSVKRATKVLHFCFIGKILHKFLMPKTIEPPPKTFVSVQMLL